jgi:hypothetical protein
MLFPVHGEADDGVGRWQHQRGAAEQRCPLWRGCGLVDLGQAAGVTPEPRLDLPWQAQWSSWRSASPLSTAAAADGNGGFTAEAASPLPWLRGH